SGNVCRSKCCKIFKRYLMQSPIEFLNTYRLEISSNLLKDTSKSVTEVAFACGFNHLSYYSELFKRYYGCTPSEYRKRGYDFQTG
ncbi:MAG: helix-turn-helix transcriptional regulator, partial [Clostridium sp.]|nr:helix-turn-helix transcriptional regulator [Clostridium sp.]